MEPVLPASSKSNRCSCCSSIHDGDLRTQSSADQNLCLCHRRIRPHHLATSPCSAIPPPHITPLPSFHAAIHLKPSRRCRRCCAEKERETAPWKEKTQRAEKKKEDDETDQRES
ncbi:hypothetical protein M0R45_005903 [Rubus argutus]|uniref:Uncharacterized protein n=1 Tax=Rubus argutus TaxID=59490 RepID=A0AAW1YPI2_RUBAR